MGLSDMLKQGRARAGLKAIVADAKTKCEVVEPSGRPSEVGIKRRLAPEVTETFVIRREQRGAAERKAAELGVQIELSRVDPDSILHLYPEFPQTSYGVYGDWEGYLRARHMALSAIAKRYLWAVVRAPQPPERVVGIAELDNGVPTFLVIPGEEDPWTPARMDRISFQRCDLCGIRHHRVRVYLVRRPDGTLFQAGGTCADNLSLAKRISNMIRAFKAFTRWLGKASDDDDFDLFAVSSGPSVYDVTTALVLADRLIAEDGYVSRGKAEELGVSPTRDVVDYYMAAEPGSKPHARKQQLLKKSARSGPALLEQGMAWARSEQQRKDSAFIRNVLAALETGSPRLIGFLAFVPEGLRRAAARKARQEAKGKLWEWQPVVPMVATKSGQFTARRLRYGDFGDKLAEVGLIVRPAASGVSMAVPADGRVVSDYALERLRYMVARSRAPVDAKLVRTWVNEDQPKQNQEEHLERTLIKAFAKAMDDAKIIAVPTGAMLLEMIRRDPMIVEWFSISDRVIAKARKNPEKRISKALSNKLGRFIPGLWKVESKRTADTSYGPIHFLRFVRSDGALLEWKASSVYIEPGLRPDWYEGSGYLDVGDTVRIVSASIGVVPPPHPSYGIQGRKVSRVQFVLSRS